MAEMKFIGIFQDRAGTIHQRNIGFNSKNVLWYSQTDDEDMTAVMVATGGVQRELFVVCPPAEFFLKKVAADNDDAQLQICYQ